MYREIISRSRIAAKRREFFLTSRPATYIRVVVGIIIVASMYEFRTDTIFSCQADGYTADRYVASCNGARYGDYEHGAFQFGLEPAAQRFARNADVLFLGNSRLQIAFSTTATADWFAAASVRYYLLGFSHGENMIFTESILRNIRPRSRVYVINVDDFFEQVETAPAKTVLHDPDAPSRYESKRLWQHIHEPICKRFAALCGGDIVIFRSRETGAYERRLPKQTKVPVSYDWEIAENVVNRNTIAAIKFLSNLSVQRKCVILTMVPTVKTKIGNANALARALGLDLVTPEVPTELLTNDGSHLDLPSAQQWSQAFFQIASSRIRSCLEQQAAAPYIGLRDSMAQ